MNNFFDDLACYFRCTPQLQLDAAVEASAKADRVFFIGNGASATMASHFAADWAKNVKKPTMVFNDGALMSAIANDYGVFRIFSLPLELHAKPGDLLYAISSSGQSENILRAADVMLAKGGDVITLTGFKFDNPLKGRGSVNFFIPSRDYGRVESAHACILHYITNRLLHVD